MLKKIVYFVDGLNSGGVENVVLQLSKGLSPSLFKVHIISLYQDQIEIEGLFPENINIFHLPFTKKQKGLLYYGLYFKKVCNLLRMISPDIIHAHNSSFSYFYLACAIKFSLGKVCVIRSIHFSGFFLLRRTLSEKVRFYFDKRGTLLLSSTIISVSPTVFQLTNNLYPATKQLCILNGVDCYGTFNPLKRNFTKKNILGLSDTDLIVVYVARIVFGKNHNTLIKAWELVMSKMNNVHLLIVGDGPLFHDVENDVERRNLRESVIFTRNVLNVSDYLAISDLAVFPSLSEGLSVVLLEKMSMKLPVVVSEISSFQNIITDNVNGVFFDTLDEIDLSIKIQTLLLDEHKRKRLGENARKTVLKNFSIDKMIKEHEQTYLQSDN